MKFKVERREGPRDEPGDLGFLLGQLVGEFKAFREDYAMDRESSREFRSGMNEQITNLTHRIQSLENSRIADRQPRAWLIWTLRIIGGGGIVAFIEKLVGRVHYGP